MKHADNGPRPANVFFRLSLWLVERASHLVPWDRREDWRRVWLGELWHRTRKLESEGGVPARQGIDLVRRSFGAFSHALLLASMEWRRRGFGKDLVHGLRSLERFSVDPDARPLEVDDPELRSSGECVTGCRSRSSRSTSWNAPASVMSRNSFTLAPAILDSPVQCGHNNHMAARKPREIGARELKTRLGAYLREVREGATLIVTERGAPVAEIRPLPTSGKTEKARLDELVARGTLTRETRKKLSSFRPIRIAGRPLSETIIEDREDRF